ncbi:hypothetical protein Btru_028677 [Bulinus truncatus]|nr:hypothetical protein Btru_028677 [Bulinus truncatus]
MYVDLCCEYGDKRTGCQKQFCGGKDTNGNNYNFFCCKTCATVSYQESILSINGTKMNCSEYVKIYTSSVCNKPEIHGNYCSTTCELNRDKDKIDCPWGDRNDCSNITNTAPPGYICNASQKINCCWTCANLNTTSTSTTKTSTTTTTQKPTVRVCSPSPCAACSTFNFVTSLVLLAVCVCFTYVTKKLRRIRAFSYIPALRFKSCKRFRTKDSGEEFTCSIMISIRYRQVIPWGDSGLVKSLPGLSVIRTGQGIDAEPVQA